MKDQKKKNNTIAELGEFGLINHLTSELIVKNSETIHSIGDDAAVLNFRGDNILITTDLLIEGIHFDLVYTPLKHLGYKSVVVNLSDIYAMNAIPKQITYSFAISNKISLSATEELYEGVKLACDNYQVDLVGGDTSSSLTGMLLSITAIGKAKSEEIVYRKNAKKGDLICVTGDLGGAFAGLQLLEREKKVFESGPGLQPVLNNYSNILEKQLKPEARKEIIELFGNQNILPGSMIDISDGLSSDLLHICDASDVGCKIFEDKIPIHNETINFAEEININPLNLALNGGEDYELLFTVSPDLNEQINAIPDISIIGKIENKSEGRFLVSKGGSSMELNPKGWNPLRN